MIYKRSSFPNCDLNDDDPSYDELEKAFHDLFDKYRKLGAKNL